ncbi:MAG: acyltransferase family protein [Acidimicrobiales bacterium]
MQGLRAVAILAVVGYHAAVPRMGGGYVGVDAFFVISGYLITGLLLAELGERGAIGLAAFYARRARRLLPSAVLVVLATVAASAVLLPPHRAQDAFRDGLASALYVANYRFAIESTSYLSAGASASPFLHYWSLGVEEQFYLVWPALMAAAALAWRGSHASRRGPAVALWIVGAASLGFSLWLTRADQPWAFFSLPSRAWELAAGGALALAAPRLERLPRAAAALIGWAGLGAIGWSVVAFTSATPFPGTAAIVPVAGAAAVVASGCVRRAAGPQLLLDLAPFQAIGRISYTWYLWHWPVLVLAPAVVGHPLTLGGRMAAVAASLVLSVLTTLVVEDPMRRARWLAGPGRGLILAGVTSVVAVASIAAAVATLPAAVGSGHARHEALASGHLRPRSTPPPPDPLAAAQREASTLTAQVQAAVARSVTTRQVPANADPSLTSASTDEAAPFVDGCFDDFTEVSVNPCDYGDTASDRTMVLFGDSHSLMWFPALDAVADQQGWRLVAAAKATCPPLDVHVFSPDLDEWYTQCTRWRQAELARIRALHPALVVLGFSREYGITNDHVVVDGPAWMQGLTRMVTTLKETGAQVVVLGDVPYPFQSVPDCLATHLGNATACLIPRAAPHYNVPGITQEQSVVTAAGGGYVDTDPWFCAGAVCAVMVENMVVYRDDNHITATYATWLTPVIEADLAVATGLLVHPPTTSTG